MGEFMADVLARFDWYAATIRDDARTVVGTLAEYLGGTVENLPKGKQGYTTASQIIVERSSVATVYSGGRNGNPHAFASGDDTDAFWPLVREFWPDAHHVTRMDSAIDYDDGEGTFDRLHSMCRDIAFDADSGRRVVKTRFAGDWDEPDDGRTYYLGSPKSAVQVRLYEKGKQLRGLALDDTKRDAISPTLVRLEVQVRPDGPARITAAHGSALEAWGYSDWSQRLLDHVEGQNVPRVHIRERRESDHERAMHWAMRQYGEHFAREAEEVGGWENLGLALYRRYLNTRATDDDAPEADLSAFKHSNARTGVPADPRGKRSRDTTDDARPF